MSMMKCVTNEGFPSFDTEKMIVEKIANEVNTIGTWLFE